jgi:4-oxalocrotonate tautomerase
MPLVRIDLRRGKPAEYRKALAGIVYTAMRETIDVPENDKFLIMTEHAPEELDVAENYLGSTFSNDIVFIQITLNAGRSLEKKRALYQSIAGDLAAQLQIRPDDVFISLVEVAKENWSFGRGIAQYAV